MLCFQKVKVLEQFMLKEYASDLLLEKIFFLLENSLKTPGI